MINKPLLVSLLAPAMLSCLLMAGCGGAGGDDPAAQPQSSPQASLQSSPQSSPQQATPASVRVEGCVVNSQWKGAPNLAVQARTEDGRVLGTTFTNQRGVFTMTVPAQSAIVLDTALSGPGQLALTTGSHSFSVGACLRADL